MAHPLGDADIILWPWLEELVEQYRAQRQERRRSRLVPMVFGAIAVLAVFTPALLHLDRAAYPQDLEKEHALQICGRTDPAFVRFFASEREACYERIGDLASRAAIARIDAPKP
jgi:hypothetical protein